MLGLSEIDLEMKREGARLPKRMSSRSAGWDCFVPVLNDPIHLIAGDFFEIDLGVGLSREIPAPFNQDYPDVYLSLHLRSSLRKKGLTIFGEGIIDPDYTGSIVIFGRYLGNGSINIDPGDRIAQIIPIVTAPGIMKKLPTNESQRGIGGMGSTGK